MSAHGTFERAQTGCTCIDCKSAPKSPGTPYQLGYRAGNYSNGPATKTDNPFVFNKARAEWDKGFDDGRFGAGGGS